jgi:hypothetical protein
VDLIRAKLVLAPNAIGGNFRVWALPALPCLNRAARAALAANPSGILQTARRGYGDFTKCASVLDGQWTSSPELEKGERRAGVRFGAKARERTASLRPRQHKLYGLGDF